MQGCRSQKLQLLQPNCFAKDDLLAARKNPEKYRHLIVKICGFSARFVALEKAWQDLIIARKMYWTETRTSVQFPIQPSLECGRKTIFA